VRIDLRRGVLVWQWRDFAGALEHFHYDTYLLSVEPVGPARVVFNLDAEGRVERMRVTGPHMDVEFRRVRAGSGGSGR
jgi:hypothetical protein